MSTIFRFAVSLCLLAAASPVAAADAARLFEKSVRPILEAKCYECHSAKADEVKGNLRLDSLEGILKGGDNGPAVRPGDDDSFLLRAIRYQEDDYQMPPSGRLEDEKIKAIEDWVKALESSGR